MKPGSICICISTPAATRITLSKPCSNRSHARWTKRARWSRGFQEYSPPRGRSLRSPIGLFKKFTVIPAIDLKSGEVVRLLRGDMAQATVYSRQPSTVAKLFEAGGAELIHVVDLDGAIAGEPRNLGAIRAIREAVSCALDVSGGLRTIGSMRAALASGASYISIGSAAILSPELLTQACREFPGRVIGAVDIRGGKLAIKGWVESSQLSAADALARFKTSGA